MRLVIGALIIALTACSEPQRVEFSTDYTFKVAAGVPTGKRVLLIHGGLSGSRAAWDRPPFSDFVTELTGQGIEVVTFDLTHVTALTFSDGGLSYRQSYEKQIRGILGRVRADHGMETELIVGGFSWGGIHAMMTQVLLPDDVDAYFAVLPVTDMSALAELRNVDARHFNPFHESLSGHRGLISWGTADERVNFRLTIDLVTEQASPTLDTIEYVGLGHTTTLQVAQDTANWVLGL